MQLTLTEYNALKNQVLRKFAEEQSKYFNERLYKVTTNHSPLRLKLLFLFSYALSTYENTNSAYNYMSEESMLKIISASK